MRRRRRRLLALRFFSSSSFEPIMGGVGSGNVSLSFLTTYSIVRDIKATMTVDAECMADVPATKLQLN